MNKKTHIELTRMVSKTHHHNDDGWMSVSFSLEEAGPICIPCDTPYTNHRVYFLGCESVVVKESYEEITKKIEEAEGRVDKNETTLEKHLIDVKMSLEAKLHSLQAKIDLAIEALEKVFPDERIDSLDKWVVCDKVKKIHHALKYHENEGENKELSKVQPPRIEK